MKGPCSPGFYCTLGATRPDPTDTVTGDVCPVGSYCPSGTGDTVKCPAGYFSNGTGNTVFDDCKPCTAGTIVPRCIWHLCNIDSNGTCLLVCFI